MIVPHAVGRLMLHIMVGALLAILVACVGVGKVEWQTSQVALLSVALGAAGMWGVFWIRGWRYERRIQADSDREWEITLDGKRVGKLTDREWAYIQQRIERNGNIALAQARTLFNIGFLVVAVTLALALTITYWNVFGVTAPSQAVFILLFSITFPPVAVSPLIAYSVIVFCIGDDFPWFNRYYEATQGTLRAYVKISAAGQVTIRAIPAHVP